MKSFKDYLIESKQTYDFRIKIAGECPDECSSKIKEALSQFDCSSCSSGKRTPIQEGQIDFPELKNVEVTIFEASVNYPATSEQVKNLIAEKLDVPASSIRVRNPSEEAEQDINEQETQKILGHDYPKENNQELVGDKHSMSLLKELGKHKKTLEQYKGVNDKILAKKPPVEKAAVSKLDKKSGSASPIGSKQVSKITAKGL
jgi:hypothetical protein